MNNALILQKRVIYALLLREIHTRYGHRRLGYLWEVVELGAHILLLSAVFALMQRSSPLGSNLGVFITVALIPYFLFTHIDKQVSTAVNGNLSLLSFPMVMPFDLMIGRTILESATSGVVILLFLALGFYFNLFLTIDSVLELIMAFATVITMGLGVGMINASIFLYFETYKSIYPLLMRPFYFISGIFFTADSLPIEAQRFLFFNPLLHVTEWVRSAFYNEYESLFLDKMYVVSVSIVFLFAGLLFERLTKEKERQVC